MQGELGEAVQPRWRYFSLNQVNHPEKDTWQVWEQPKVNPTWQTEKYAPALYYFWAAEAARRQGEEVFRRFHMALLKAKHEEPKQKLAEREEVAAIAAEVSLDMARFEADFNDPTCLDRLAEDHQASLEKNVFGTPTFVFSGAKPAYLKLERVLTKEEALDFWEVFRATITGRSYVLEIKRPQ